MRNKRLNKKVINICWAREFRHADAKRYFSTWHLCYFLFLLLVFINIWFLAPDNFWYRREAYP